MLPVRPPPGAKYRRLTPCRGVPKTGGRRLWLTAKPGKEKELDKLMFPCIIILYIIKEENMRKAKAEKLELVMKAAPKILAAMIPVATRGMGENKKRTFWNEVMAGIELMDKKKKGA